MHNEYTKHTSNIQQPVSFFFNPLQDIPTHPEHNALL